MALENVLSYWLWYADVARWIVWPLYACLMTIPSSIYILQQAQDLRYPALRRMICNSQKDVIVAWFDIFHNRVDIRPVFKPTKCPV